MSSKHIAIPALLKIGPGVLNQLGEYLKELDLEKVVILFGNGLIDMFGTAVMESLKDADIEVVEYQELDTVRLEDLTSLLSAAGFTDIRADRQGPQGELGRIFIRCRRKEN